VPPSSALALLNPLRGRSSHHSRGDSARERSGHHPAAPRLTLTDRPGASSESPATPSMADPASLMASDRLALTVGEAGALLGISRALAYELVARGELPSLRLGRRLVVPKVALLEMLGLSPRRPA
jgi:excisionase family DNA binding protein